nr:helix-turn-helix domain-containing protein [Haladaptatus sp. DYF46]
MIAAYEQGWYEIPRRTTTEDLAAEIRVLHQAISERLRQGQSC